jgi:signal transduction histidine kinase
MIEDGASVLEQVAFGSDQARAAYQMLLDAYRASYREKRRLVRVSDKLQERLAGVNEELQSSKQAAEEALDRLQETQENLIQAEKLASLGVLVAGVAHEINTPVGTALASASFLAKRTQEVEGDFRDAKLKRSDLERYIAAAGEASALILSNCQRAAELIRGFKQVAVDQTSAGQRRFGLAAYIAEVLVSLGPRLKQVPHRVEVDCPEDLVLEGIPGAVSQVLTNLIMNSLMHGYAPGQVGTLSIRVDRLDGGLLRLAYHDDGRGIPAADLPRIFDPFFTTRRGNGGSGLGLHVVYNTVVGTLKGQITVESTPGQGTLFTLIFPASIPAAEADGPA